MQHTINAGKQGGAGTETESAHFLLKQVLTKSFKIIKNSAS